MKDITLVVMAAGIGSRFGGLKQLEPIGPNGEVIVDYSVYDAMKAGFTKIVFIISRAIEEDFRRLVGDRIAKKIKVEYVYQDTPDYRKKPMGTGHAVLSCKGAVDTPFAVINTDDYYDREAFMLMAQHLLSSTDYAMVGFYLRNTLTENGTVARGICEVKDGLLVDVTEHTAIPKDNDFPENTIVSMNLWGMQPNVFDALEADFEVFVQNMKNPEKDEFFLPSVIDRMVKDGREKVHVFVSPDSWYGVTYREDKETVVNAIRKMVEEGKYEGI